MWLVHDNVDALMERGIYERCLAQAFIGAGVNNRHVQLSVLQGLFEHADRARLRAAGQPLPSPGPFTLYRGVSGRGAARRVRGMSWTSSLPIACWFAQRFGGESPAVVSLVASADEVLFYTSDRNEDEFVIFPPAKVSRVRIPPRELSAHAHEHGRQVVAHNTGAIRRPA